MSLLAASGAMSETIPPSLVLITIGSVTGVSIAALFTGGLLPAPGAGAGAGGGRALARRGRGPGGVVRAAVARRSARAFLVALPALVLPFVIRTAVIEGVATATEVSTIGIVYAAIAGMLVYRRFPLAAAVSDAGGDGGAVRRDPADHRHRDRRWPGR